MILTILAGTAFLWDIAVGLIVLPLPLLIATLPAVRWVNLDVGYSIGLEIIFIVFPIRE